MRVLRCLMVFYNFAYGCGVWWRNGDPISSRTPKRRRARIAFPDSDVRILMAVLLGGAIPGVIVCCLVTSAALPLAVPRGNVKFVDMLLHQPPSTKAAMQRDRG